MMKINARELEGAALDWAVAKAGGWHMIPVPPDYNGENGGCNVLAPPTVNPGEWVFPPKGRIHPGYFLKRWSTNWMDGGGLIERHMIQLHTHTGDQHGKHERWYAVVPTSASGSRAAMGPTPLVAAMRALVFAKLGEWVEIPDELAG